VLEFYLKLFLTLPGHTDFSTISALVAVDVFTTARAD
jgi:hypothetical protein